MSSVGSLVKNHGHEAHKLFFALLTSVKPPFKPFSFPLARVGSTTATKVILLVSRVLAGSSLQLE